MSILKFIAKLGNFEVLNIFFKIPDDTYNWQDCPPWPWAGQGMIAENQG